VKTMLLDKIKYLSPGIDNNGRAFRCGNEIYREIYPHAQPFCRSLLIDKQLIKELTEIGFVETEISEFDEKSQKLILKHEKMPFISYCIEWSFDMLKDAALIIIDLVRILYTHNLTLKDGHPYNILFNYTKPIFIDFSSIMKSDSRKKSAWEASFHGEFVVPLLMQSNNLKRILRWYSYWENKPEQKGRFYSYFYKLWLLWRIFFADKRDCYYSFRALENFVRKIKLKQYNTEWENYYSRGQTAKFEDSTLYTNKEKSAIYYMELLFSKGQKTLLDIGANEGWFSLAAEKIGYEVVAFDCDERSINNLYTKIRGTNKKILPLVMDFTKPTERYGIGNVWMCASDRLKCDVTLSMAVLHHLTLTQNMHFEEFAERLASFTKNYAIIEFVGREDIHIRNRLANKDWYTEQNFLKAMEKIFCLQSELVSEPNTRKVFLFKKL